MKVQITFKLTAESRDELMKTMGPDYRRFRAFMEERIHANFFGPAEKIKARWLLTPGQWDGSPTNVEQGEPMSEPTDTIESVNEAGPVEAEAVSPVDKPNRVELPIPALDWCSGTVQSFDQIQNLCQQLSTFQWNVVQILPVASKIVGGNGFGVVAFRAQALRFVDKLVNEPAVVDAESNTPDDRYNS